MLPWRRKRLSEAVSAHSARSTRKAVGEPVGREPQDAELRLVLGPEPDDDEEAVTVRLGQLHLAQGRRAPHEPSADHVSAADEREPRLCRRRADDDGQPAVDAARSLCTRELLLGRERRPAGPVGSHISDGYACTSGPSGPTRTMSALVSASGVARDQIARRTERANDGLRRSGVEDVDRPVAADREIALAAGESRSAPASSPAPGRSLEQPVVHLVEHDDGAVRSDVERRRPDPRLLLAAVEPDRLARPCPR